MKSNIKIFHTMTWLAPGGGADSEVFLALRELVNHYDIELATGIDIQRNEFAHISGLKMHMCKHMVRPIKPWKDLKSIWWFYKLIKKNKYDIVHTHESKASLITRIAAWLAGTKIIIYGLHGVPFNDPLSKLVRTTYILLEKSTFWMYDLIIPVGQDTMDQYHNNNIGKNIPYRIIYSGIETQKFIKNETSNLAAAQLRTDLGISEDEIVIVNVGRFSHSKAQRFLIESFSLLRKKHENIKLLFIGEGPCKEDCEKLSNSLGVEKDIIFYGFSDDVPQLLHASDIFVLTSLREGLPTVVVEASLTKIPTVSFEVEGIHEITKQNESGFIVPSKDINALTEKISDLIQDDKKRELFGNKAFEIAKGKWDYTNMNNNLRDVYDSLIKKRDSDG